MEPEILMLAIGAVALGSVVQGMSGVGGGFISVPLLAIIDMRLLPGALIFGSLSISAVMAWRERGHIDRRNVPAILLATLPGAVAGASLLASVTPDRLGMVFGGVILFAIAITAAGLHLPLTRVTGALAGALAGAMGASSGIGAPAIAILYQREPGPRVRATLAVIYTGASLLIIAALIAFGKFGWGDVRSGALLMPGFLLGYLLSVPLALRFDHGATRYIVLAVSAIAALVLLVDSL